MGILWYSRLRKTPPGKQRSHAHPIFRENSGSHGCHQWSLDRLLHPRNTAWWLSPIDSPKIMEWVRQVGWHFPFPTEWKVIIHSCSKPPTRTAWFWESPDSRAVNPTGSSDWRDTCGQTMTNRYANIWGRDTFLKSTSNDNFWMHWTMGSISHIWIHLTFSYYRILSGFQMPSNSEEMLDKKLLRTCQGTYPRSVWPGSWQCSDSRWLCEHSESDWAEG